MFCVCVFFCFFFLGKPTDLLKQYFNMFGDKARCFADMRPYLAMLGDKDKSQVRIFLLIMKQKQKK